MEALTQSSNPEPAAEAPPAPQAEVPLAAQNDSVTRCANAWQRTADLCSCMPAKKRVDDDYDFFTRRKCQAAFRKAMPPLAGHQNIQDFIACTAYALVNDILLPQQCQQLFNCAKYALSALRASSKD